MNLKISASIAALAMLVVAPLAATAATPFAGEDFDGGSTNGGFTSATQVFTPDLSGTTPVASFGGNFFDRYGIVDRSVLPFDFLDDSAGTFPPDNIGILDSTKLDNVVILADTNNGSNPGGAVSATWTFDISGKSNIELAIDFAMIGDFEDTDVYNFSYSIDGGSSTSAFDIQTDQDDTGFGLEDSGIFYGVNMESGGFFDRYSTPFFEQNDWLDLTTNGETPGAILFLTRDDGTNGDSVAQDGLVPITSLGGTLEERAYVAINGFGTFDQIEKVAYKDPLFVNPTSAPDATSNNFDTGTQLTDDFQMISVPVSGTGTTLTLEFTAVTNSSQEALIFDNILLSEGTASVLPGDANGDGTVDLLDLDILGTNFGASPATFAEGDFNGDNVVDLLDLDILGTNFGATSPSSAIPEPTALMLVTLAAGLGFARRR